MKTARLHPLMFPLLSSSGKNSFRALFLKCILNLGLYIVEGGGESLASFRSVGVLP